MRRNKEAGGVRPVTFLSLNGGRPQQVTGQIVEESMACISVNGIELATFMCSPTDLDLLAIGFLYNERLIESLDDIASLHLSDSNCVDLWLHHEFERPKRLIVTAGCGGGQTFDDLSQEHPPLDLDTQAHANTLAERMKDLHLGAELYQQARGIHTAALADEQGLLLQVEDIGRHNCLDKLAGAALKNRVPTRGRILLSSGRISSEMLNKARRMECPIVCSRTSPTSLSVSLAERWNISIVAYLRQSRMRIYSHPERVLLELEQPSDGSRHPQVHNNTAEST
jgi:FdhD protein